MGYDRLVKTKDISNSIPHKSGNILDPISFLPWDIFIEDFPFTKVSILKDTFSFFAHTLRLK